MSGESTSWLSLVLGVVIGTAVGAWWGAVAIGAQVAAIAGVIGAIVAVIAGDRRWNGRPAAFIAGGGLALVVSAGTFGDAERATDMEQAIGEGRIRGVVRGVVTSGPEPLREGWGVEVRVEAIDDGRVPADGDQIRVFLEGRPLESSAAVEVPVVGDRVEMFARLERYPRRMFPGVPSSRWRMRNRGVVARGVVLDETIERYARQSGPIWQIRRTLSRTRLDYTRAVTRHLEPEAASYVLAMSAGARGLLADEQYAPFRRTGTAHLLAISGLHLGILAWMIWTVLSWFAGLWPGLLNRFGRRRVCAVPMICLLGAYVVMIGAPVSAVRAFLMVVAVAAARLAVRPVDSFHALGAALIGVLAWEPAQIVSLGCHLSFAATFAILWFLRRRPPVLRPDVATERETSVAVRWARRAGVGAGVSLSATLATWPVLLGWNGAVPVDGLWTNVVVTPMASLALVPAIFGGAALFSVSPTLGQPVLASAGAAMARLAEGLEVIAAAPPYAIVTGQLGVSTALLLGIGMVTFVGSRLRVRPVLVGAGLVATALAIGTLRHAPPDGEMWVHFIPVGQGDATLVRLPDGGTVLVDAGGQRLGADPGRRTVVPYLHRLGIARLDRVIATHADFDHVGGLVAVAERMRPAAFVYHPDEEAQRLQRVVETMEGVGTRIVRLEEQIRLVEQPAEVRTWKPAIGAVGGDNDISLVTRITYEGRSVLLPGDIEEAGERWFVEACRSSGFCDADVLKVPHHGSKTSSTEAFLRTTRPGTATVSAGKFNAFGHPAEAVVERYERRGIPFWETAQHGLVRAIVREDGEMEVRAMRPGAGE